MTTLLIEYIALACKKKEYMKNGRYAQPARSAYMRLVLKWDSIVVAKYGCVLV